MKPTPFPDGPRNQLLPEDEARARILAQLQVLPTATVPLLEALDRYAASDRLATQSLPTFDNSSMDGYALPLDEHEEKIPVGTRFAVTGEQAAGPDRGLHCQPGQAIRIFTGAPIPAGAGAVIMQEDVTRSGEQITVREAVEPGENIRRRGADLAAGQKILNAGDHLSSQRLGLLASQGLSEIDVARRPKVAVLATGDELQAPGKPLGPGEIYESNAILLAALARSFGAEVTLLERAKDERADLDAKLNLGLRAQDVLVVAGGVSVGERDLVKERLAAAGVSLDLWRVRIRPGKPFLYGHYHPEASTNATHVFGLPGNPVSAFVTFLLFVRPALRRLQGAAADQVRLPSFPAPAATDLTHPGDRPHYLRGTLDEQGRFVPVGRQESHALFALSRSRVLARMEPKSTILAGETLPVFHW